MKAVIFDVGRVLVHWNPQAVLSGLARISQVDETVLGTLLHAVSHDLGVGAMGAQALHAYLVEQAGTSTAWDVFFDAFCSGLARDETGLRFADELWRQGVPIGVISNTNAAHVLWLREQAPEFGRWRPVIFSSDVGLLKPDAAIYSLALKEMGAAPQEALFVDDLPENVLGAQAVGMGGLVHQDWGETQAHIESWLAAE